MPKLMATVTVSGGEGEPAERERRVASLEDLYAACREAPPSKLVRISIRGEAGEVRLNFASFIQRRKR
jgi:hypothetical protein